MCRGRLLDRADIPCPLKFIRPISPSTRVIPLPTLVPSPPRICTLKVIPLHIPKRGNRVHCRKTAPMACPRVGRLPICPLLKKILLSLGAIKLLTTCSAAAPLYLEGFSRAINLLLVTSRPKLPSIGLLLKDIVTPPSLTTPPLSTEQYFFPWQQNLLQTVEVFVPVMFLVKGPL